MFQIEVEATIATPHRRLKCPPFRPQFIHRNHCPGANFVWFNLIIST
jgi:hypothetical protein